MASKSRYECNFVSEPDDTLKCLICLEVARDPWQHGKCGRLFCNECLNKYGKDEPCPNCRMEQPLYLEDTRSRRDIKGLQVKCDNVKEGCQWEGTIDTLDQHLKSCDYIEVSCKYESIGCDELVKRKDLKTHEQDDSHHLKKALEAIAVLKEEKTTLRKSILIKLTNFKMKKANSETFISSSFYVGLEGYHMTIKIYPNGIGDGKGTHVSVYAQFLGGKYDHKLSWPFVGTVTCTLLNQLADKNHFTKKLVEPEDVKQFKTSLHPGQRVGYTKCISHEDLSTDKAKYLMNDTLYFKVTAEAACQKPCQKPWLEPE